MQVPQFQSIPQHHSRHKHVRVPFPTVPSSYNHQSLVRRHDRTPQPRIAGAPSVVFAPTRQPTPIRHLRPQSLSPGTQRPCTAQRSRSAALHNLPGLHAPRNPGLLHSLRLTPTPAPLRRRRHFCRSRYARPGITPNAPNRRMRSPGADSDDDGA
jgi:hypothetical protein